MIVITYPKSMNRNKFWNIFNPDINIDSGLLMKSTNQTARIAGLIYLLLSVTGAFSI